MSIFKKKKKLAPTEVLREFEVLFPKVIKESKIKPTKCNCCLTVYQAQKKHFRLEPDIAYRFEKYMVHTQCPICRNINAVEFEEGEG